MFILSTTSRGNYSKSLCCFSTSFSFRRLNSCCRSRTRFSQSEETVIAFSFLRPSVDWACASSSLSAIRVCSEGKVEIINSAGTGVCLPCYATDARILIFPGVVVDLISTGAVPQSTGRGLVNVASSATSCPCPSISNLTS